MLFLISSERYAVSPAFAFTFPSTNCIASAAGLSSEPGISLEFPPVTVIVPAVPVPATAVSFFLAPSTEETLTVCEPAVRGLNVSSTALPVVVTSA